MATDRHQATKIIEQLRRIVGPRHVLTGGGARRFETGYRSGGGAALAVARPGTLVEMWRAAQVCMRANIIVIVQAANTGLTGGSTPEGRYDRPVVIISTMRLDRIHMLRGGRQVVCLPGATLNDLEGRLAPLGREPHSVIGSSCLGASVVGGVCNNAGGALVQRGPAFTQYAVFARVDERGDLVLCNRLGVRLGDDPEAMLERLDEGRFGDADVEADDRLASAAGRYDAIVRGIDEPTPARFNADPQWLFEASGSAGKVMVFAVRLDTFSKPQDERVFYIGTNAPAALSALRRRILIESPVLPVSGEYIHREAFDLADHYGRDTVLAIRWLGTRRLPQLFAAKAWVDRTAIRLGDRRGGFADRLLQGIGRLCPDPLPARLRAFRDRFEHHLILKIAGDGAAGLEAILSETIRNGDGAVFECTPAEASAAMLHRFAVAGAGVRYRAVHPERISDIVALDIALPRNAIDWFEQLPDRLASQISHKLYYGHFFCHVLHQDYLVRKGYDAVALKRDLLALMDARNAEYPAEHNVGHSYFAKPALVEHYRRLDPRNAFNPGLGGSSRVVDWL